MLRGSYEDDFSSMHLGRKSGNHFGKGDTVEPSRLVLKVQPGTLFFSKSGHNAAQYLLIGRVAGVNR
jgi:hypothetical protein